MISSPPKNQLFTGDCLHVMTGLNSASVDLIYLDPPFNTKRTYSAPVGSKAAGSSFKDMWTWEDVDEAYLERMIDDYPYLVQYISAVEVIHGKPMMAYLTYMTQRILEMRRLLKPTGSLYLHCDPTASHYLKVILDRVFGVKNFRNEIIWERIKGAGKSSQHASRAFGRSSDTLLFYSQSDAGFFNIKNTAMPYPNLRQSFPYQDQYGRYKRRSPFRPPGLGARPNLCYEYRGIYPPRASGWTVKESKLKDLDETGQIEWVSGKPWRKQRPGAGILPNNVWTDIAQTQGTEKTGYPTQKPLALLKRIIQASSREGDVVFDPFCGCATTCVAAQQLHRRWIGIDVESKAASVLVDRLSDDAGLFKDFIHRTDTPQRTDIKIEKPGRSIKSRLYEQQDGQCNGCETEFAIQHFEIDHIVPCAKGGGDYYDNYQLLCGHCNRTKGDRPMDYLRAKIKRQEQHLKRHVTFGG